MLQNRLVRGVAIVFVTAACVTEDGDDDTQGEATASSGETSSTAGDSTGSAPESCFDAREAAAAFVAANSACQVDEDCTAVIALCVQEGQVCGGIPLSVGYDEAAWVEIEEALSTCTECGGDPCGPCSVCTNSTCDLTLDCG